MSEEAGHDEYLDKILRLKHVRMIVNFVKKIRVSLIMSEKRTTFDFIYVIKLLTSEIIKLKKMSLSLSITPSDIIRKHPTNNSTSKQVYRFPKSPRFASPNPEYFQSKSDAPMLFTLLIVSFRREKQDSVMVKSRTLPKLLQ